MRSDSCELQEKLRSTQFSTVILLNFTALVHTQEWNMSSVKLLYGNISIGCVPTSDFDDKIYASKIDHRQGENQVFRVWGLSHILQKDNYTA
jgi:hypothetical protein